MRIIKSIPSNLPGQLYWGLKLEFLLIFRIKFCSNSNLDCKAVFCIIYPNIISIHSVVKFKINENREKQRREKDPCAG